MAEVENTGIRFFSDFDSANLAKVELVPHTDSIVIAANNSANGKTLELPDVEFNLWTRPDCAGTEFENGNRTWFYFGVQADNGGLLVKLNLVDINRQSKMYGQGMCPVYRVLPGKMTWERIRDKPTFNVDENIFTLTFKYKTPENTQSITYFAFTYPYTYTELQNSLSPYDRRFPISSGDDIYYVRECVCHSLEGRRVDLITISSFHGITSEREPRLKNLFPEENNARPFIFSGKKVIFVSARVHPGETPSSFVFNGFLNLLLSRDDPIAVTLRRTYVFKLIPFLNPDGVVKGHYRTDTRGVNLNRVYLNPDLKLHPSIYAARAVLRYHHFGYEKEDEIDAVDYNVNYLDGTSSSEDLGTLSYSPSPPNTDTKLTKQVLHMTLQERKRNSKNMSRANRLWCCDCQKKKSTECRKCLRILGASDDVNGNSTNTNDVAVQTAALQSTGDRRQNSPSKTAGAASTSGPAAVLVEPSIGDQGRRLGGGLDPTEANTAEDSSNNCTACGDSGSGSAGASSGLFLYMDLHGHASKKGIFMYGNHFKDVEKNVKCMLLPKLMSLNNHNFHFTNCNFTERNMYLKDRRDGMSREGSGRVAVLKMTGLIRSYTLECNYNTGRIVNVLPSTVKEVNSKAMHTVHVPPKYSPLVFEEVGKAMGGSILDLTGSNPLTRLPNSEFRSLEGLKDWLRIHLRNEAGIGFGGGRLPKISYGTSNCIGTSNANNSNFAQGSSNSNQRKKIKATRAVCVSPATQRSKTIRSSLSSKCLAHHHSSNIGSNKRTSSLTAPHLHKSTRTQHSSAPAAGKCAPMHHHHKENQVLSTVQQQNLLAAIAAAPGTSTNMKLCNRNPISSLGAAKRFQLGAPCPKTPQLALRGRNVPLKESAALKCQAGAKGENARVAVSGDISSAKSTPRQMKLQEICLVKSNGGKSKKLVAKYLYETGPDPIPGQGQMGNVAGAGSGKPENLIVAWNGPSSAPQVFSEKFVGQCGDLSGPSTSAGSPHQGVAKVACRKPGAMNSVNEESQSSSASTRGRYSGYRVAKFSGFKHKRLKINKPLTGGGSNVKGKTDKFKGRKKVRPKLS